MKKNLLLLFAILFTAFNVNAQNPTVVSITGEAVGGWGDGHDFNMTSTDGVNWTYTGLIVASANSPVGTTDGGIKFRANNAWAINWGSASWPSGTGATGGANIQCIAGTYDVTFNSTTGEYNFSGGAPIPVVKLIGTAVSDAAGLSMSTLDLATFTASNVTLLAGNAQFSIDATTVVGGTTFPTGTVSDGTQFIPIPAGSYTSISLNINTSEYSFVAAPIFAEVSIVGSGAAGWSTDTNLTTTDGINYVLNGITLSAWDGVAGSGSGEIKFRQGHAWTLPSWGDVAFPSGTATATGSNIVVTTPGTYIVKFNIQTGVYSFEFAVISITGDATGGWGDGFDFDMTTTDGANYTRNSVTLVAGGAKFRLGHAWATAWGNTDYPSGIATTTGGNIAVTTAGDFSATFNILTGAYAFAAPLATKGFTSGNFKVYPNPTVNNWNFSSLKQNIETIQILDILGKSVLTISPKNTTANVDASNLTKGIYFARIATATTIETVKLVKN